MNSPVLPRKNPFPGLRPFQQEDSDLFFGREAHTRELLRRLNLSRFVAVVGTSGSGKSSIVRAGVIPALYGDFLEDAGSHWRTAVFRPGEDPISSLGDSLHALFPRATSAEEEKFQRKMLETTLRRGSTGLVTAVHQANLPTFENLLVVVDQFEELFRFTKAIPRPEVSDVAAAFVKLLLEAAKAGDVRVYIIVTLRSDFIGDCSQFRDLPEAVNEGLYLIPRLTRDQLREAIVGPAAMFGAQLSRELVQQLLNDVDDDQDQLPVHQHALMRTWKEKDLIELRDYQETGGMAAALDKHAEEAFDELPDQRNRDVAKQLFQSITEKGPDNREIRRPTTLGEICAIANASQEEVGRIIECFRGQDRAFLMPPRSEALHSDRLIDISHESLIRKWKRLRLWVEEEAQSRETCLRIADAAMRFEANQTGLLRDPDLQLALKWWKAKNPSSAWGKRCSDRFSLVLPFLKQSEFDRNAEIAAKEREAQRQVEIARQHAREQAQAATHLRRIAWVLFVVTVFAIGAAIYGGVMQRQAQRNASLAQAGRLELLAKGANLAAYEMDLKGAAEEAGRLWTSADNFLRDAHKLMGIRTTYLTVKSEPGAWIFVDGESRSKVGGSGESRTLVLSSGMHTVRVAKKEFEPFEENRTFPAGALPPLMAPLKRVTFAPEFTDAYFEGKKYWSAPESWQVKEGKLFVSGVGIGFLRDRIYKDFEASFDLRFLDGKGAAWILRADNDKNYYLFELLGPKGNPPNIFRTFKKQIGHLLTISTVSVVEDLDDPNGWFRITIKARGSTVTHWREVATGPHKIGILEDELDYFAYGKIGFGTLNGAEYYVGPITIKPFSDTRAEARLRRQKKQLR